MKTITNDRILIVDFTLTLLVMAGIFLLAPVCVEFFADLLNGLNDQFLEFKNQASDYYA